MRADAVHVIGWSAIVAVWLTLAWMLLVMVALVVFLIGATRYSASYTDEEFAEVLIGADADEVARRLGSPLVRHWDGPDREWWAFSESPSGNSYWMRAVRVEDGRVVGKYAAWYND